MNPPETMMAVVTTGNGDYDKLEYREVKTPAPQRGEVLIRVLAAGVNNTEINTRLGWYSSSVVEGTSVESEEARQAPVEREDGGWNEKTPFPLIQGTDCCGLVVALGEATNESLLGKRVLVRPCSRGREGFASMENVWMASDFDGAFAQFVKVSATEVFPVDSKWTDVELGSIPCAYGSAENMIHRARVGAGDHVLIPGASGGVGSAAVQLAKRRGAIVRALCGEAKVERVRCLGADYVHSGRPGRPGWDVLMASLKEKVDVVIDNVGGEGFPDMLGALKRGGRFVTSGAISGPMTHLDLRTLYLKDLTLIGTTAWDEPVFPNLVQYIERDEIKPVIAGSFPLKEIARAQRLFSEKKHVGKFVLTPPALCAGVGA